MRERRRLQTLDLLCWRTKLLRSASAAAELGGVAFQVDRFSGRWQLGSDDGVGESIEKLFKKLFSLSIPTVLESLSGCC